ncbi:MAG: hypothetical protein HY681_09395 [Chloroflexi bacterium]|nr:hypothetical protein [Chloroflexota bacterium]
MKEKTKLDLDLFLATHPVFRLQDLAQARGQAEALAPARNQLKHHLRRGRVRRVARMVYAALPPGRQPDTFAPDPLLVATALRPGAVFSHHTALELLGAGHSLWRDQTLFCDDPGPALALGPQRLHLLGHPTVLRRRHLTRLGLRQGERQGREFVFTGPERALVEGFRQPRWVGGLEELLNCAAGIGVLDLDLLLRVLTVYEQQILWAAAGWFLETHQTAFSVPNPYLARLEGKRPPGPRYLDRGQRGGRLVSRWNLIVPRYLLDWEGQHDQP